MITPNTQICNKRPQTAITPKVLRQVSALGSLGWTCVRIADETGISSGRVSYILRAERHVLSQDWDEAARCLKDGGSNPKYYEFFCDRYEVAMPDYLRDVYLEGKKKYRDAEKAKQDEDQLAMEDAHSDQDAATQNEDLYLLKILEALTRQGDLLEQIMEVVLPKCAIDIKDNINNNADLVCERIKNCEKQLEKISCNTRKRGL